MGCNRKFFSGTKTSHAAAFVENGKAGTAGLCHLLIDPTASTLGAVQVSSNSRAEAQLFETFFVFSPVSEPKYLEVHVGAIAKSQAVTFTGDLGTQSSASPHASATIAQGVRERVITLSGAEPVLDDSEPFLLEIGAGNQTWFQLKLLAMNRCTVSELSQAFASAGASVLARVTVGNVLDEAMQVIPGAVALSRSGFNYLPIVSRYPDTGPSVTYSSSRSANAGLMAVAAIDISEDSRYVVAGLAGDKSPDQITNLSVLDRWNDVVEVRELPDDASHCHEMALSDDGRWIAATCQFSEAGVRVVVGDRSGATPWHTVPGPANASDANVSVSANGRWAAFERHSEATDIVIWDAQTGVAETLDLHAAGYSGTANRSKPVISATGDSVLVLATPVAAHSKVAVAELTPLVWQRDSGTIKAVNDPVTGDAMRVFDATLSSDASVVAMLMPSVDAAESVVIVRLQFLATGLREDILYRADAKPQPGSLTLDRQGCRGTFAALDGVPEGEGESGTPQIVTFDCETGTASGELLKNIAPVESPLAYPVISGNGRSVVVPGASSSVAGQVGDIAILDRASDCAAGVKQIPPLSWTLLTLPCQPPELLNSLRNVFASNIKGQFGTDWIIYQFNPESGAYKVADPESVITPGVGYWFVHANTEPVLLEMPIGSTAFPPGRVAGLCDSEHGCISADLSNLATISRWSMVGVPSDVNVELSNPLIFADTGSCAQREGCTISNADLSGETLLDSVVYTHDGSDSFPGYTALTLGQPGELTAWNGFWLQRGDGADNNTVAISFERMLEETGF